MIFTKKILIPHLKGCFTNKYTFSYKIVRISCSVERINSYTRLNNRSLQRQQNFITYRHCLRDAYFSNNWIYSDWCTLSTQSRRPRDGLRNMQIRGRKYLYNVCRTFYKTSTQHFHDSYTLYFCSSGIHSKLRRFFIFNL